MTGRRCLRRVEIHNIEGPSFSKPLRRIEILKIRRPSGTLGHRRLDAPENNPSSQEYLLGGVYPSPYRLPLAKVELHISPPPFRNQDGAKVALEVLKKVSQRFFGVLWVSFGVLGVQFWLLFGVSCLRVCFCIDFGSQNGAKIDDLRRS